MKNIFKQGDKKVFTKSVLNSDIAAFESGTVHHVYSTFALARDAEWSGRLFVLEMKEPHEEGIGTSITIEHKSPAFVNSEIEITSTFEEVSDTGELITSFVVTCQGRVLAKGKQGQRILPIEKLNSIFEKLKDATL